MHEAYVNGKSHLFMV